LRNPDLTGGIGGSESHEMGGESVYGLRADLLQLFLAGQVLLQIG
jgi:hypothetical protein